MGQYVDLLLTCVINPKSECINIINVRKQFSLSPWAVRDCWLHEFKKYTRIIRATQDKKDHLKHKQFSDIFRKTVNQRNFLNEN